MALKDDLLVWVEVSLKKEIELKADGVVDALLAKLEEQTPGWLDTLIEAQKAGIKASFKAELLKLADKISANV